MFCMAPASVQLPVVCDAGYHVHVDTKPSSSTADTAFHGLLPTHTDVNAALVHTVGLIAAHTLHTLHTSRQQLVVRTGPQVRLA